MAKSNKPETPCHCPVAAYARAVVAGGIVAGRLVRLACQRHLDDLEHGHERGLRWDADAAAHALQFFTYLRLFEGEHAGKPFTLQPWQQFIVGSLFGWKGPDGFRRFRTAYVEVGKGNGKSPMAGAIGLYCLLADNEASAEVYSAATTRDQAKILFRDAKRMAEASPAMAKVVTVFEHNLSHERSGSYFRPLSSEGKSLDGKRVACALLDEIHEHPSALVVDKMRAGTKGRRQALIFEITNSGFDKQSVCWHHHEYSQAVLEGRTPNDAWFAYVCQLDPCQACQEAGKLSPDDSCPRCDHWDDETKWLKANPNLGVSVTLKYLREQVAEAKGMPSKQGIVKRLNFCIWTEAKFSWLPAALWGKGSGQLAARELLGQRCYGGLDLAARFDVCAFVLVFPWESGYRLLPRFWIPEDCADEREKADRVPYRLWASQGLVTLTPGNVTDYSLVREAIEADAQAYQIEEVAYDPSEATETALALQAFGVRMIEFHQNMNNFSEPTKQFEALLKEGRLAHGDDSVLNWMAGNVQVITDRQGRIRPVKPEHGSGKKIDGIVAAIMGLGRAMLRPPDGDGGVEFW